MAADMTSSTSGPDKKESRRAVIGALRQSDAPAMTAGMIAEQIDFSRRTVHSRLKDLEEGGEISSTKIGSATAYWVDKASTGGRPPSISDEDLVALFNERATMQNPFLTTGDVARKLDVSTETARKHLQNREEYVGYEAGRGQIWLREGDQLVDGETGEQLFTSQFGSGD